MERIRLKSYSQGVRADIDADAFASNGDLLRERGVICWSHRPN